MSKNEKVLESAEQRAQRISSKVGLQIGQTVAHPNEDRAFRLKEINGNEAVVFIPADLSGTGEAIEKTFPLSELYDPHEARRIALLENSLK